MLILLQIINRIEDLDLFENLFSDLDFELNELGYKHNPNELINEMLDNHFGLYLEDNRQLSNLTKCILNKKFKSGLKIERMRRNYNG